MTCSSGASRRQRVSAIKSPWRELMKRRSLAARLAILAGCALVLAGVGSMAGAAPAAADMNLEGLKPPAVPEIPEPPEVTPPEPSNCGCAPMFTIEKLQEIAGSKRGFTTSPLTGAVGQTVEYQIVVTNTGDVSLVLTEFTDEHCDANTLAGGPGQSAVASGGSTTYTCTRALVSEGKFANEASVIGTPPGGQPLTKTSNQVVVEVPPAAKVPPAAIIAPPVSSPQVPKIAVKCFFAVKPILRGASGTKRKPFMLRLAGIGALKQVSLYLDGRKLKMLRHAQLKSGRFSMRIDPRKLRYGAHKVLITMAALEAGCPGCRLSSVFVDPPPTQPPPG